MKKSELQQIIREEIVKELFDTKEKNTKKLNKSIKKRWIKLKNLQKIMQEN